MPGASRGREEGEDEVMKEGRCEDSLCQWGQWLCVCAGLGAWVALCHPRPSAASRVLAVTAGASAGFGAWCIPNLSLGHSRKIQLSKARKNALVTQGLEQVQGLEDAK